MDNKSINNYGNYAEENNGEMNVVHTKLEKNSDENWYQQWWFISLLIGTIGTILLYVNFQSIQLSIGIGIMLFIVSILFNPKRRFFRVATGILAIGAVSLFPSIMDYISKIFALNIHTNPWIGGLLICSSMFLYYLDSKQK